MRRTRNTRAPTGATRWATATPASATASGSRTNAKPPSSNRRATVGREELLRLLDLAGKDSPSEQGAELAVTPAQTEPDLPAGPTALDLDAWALRKGTELLAES